HHDMTHGSHTQDSTFSSAIALGSLPQRQLLCAIENVAQEAVEHQQAPQRPTMIARSRLMIVDELTKVRVVEKSGGGKALPEHRAAHAFAQRTPEPARDRHREAHL